MKDLKLDEHTGLVLEGGGMRGVSVSYTHLTLPTNSRV